MFDLYSQRTNKASGEPEIYVYDVFPKAFRTQFFYAISDVLDMYKHGYDEWDYLWKIFAREKGFKGSVSQPLTIRDKIEIYIEACANSDLIDLIDFTLNIFEEKYRKYPPPYTGTSTQEINTKIDIAIHELNTRFRQHNIGFEFMNGGLIRKDNEVIHQTIVKPALKLLLDNNFSGAEQEFLSAFEHRRKGENKDAILDALKSFESTMKTICANAGYPYDPVKNNAKDLIGILESNNFYPSYMSSHITSIRVSLESGLPTLRNKNAGHGQGATVVNVSDEFTDYALHLAATNIVLLVSLFEKTKLGTP